MENKHFLHHLIESGIWFFAVKNNIIYENGFIQKILAIHEDLKGIYNTFWEIKKTLVDMKRSLGKGQYASAVLLKIEGKVKISK